MTTSAQRQFLISVSGVSGWFATKTGGETSADTTAVWNGGRKTPERLAGPAETDNVTVGRPFDPDRDRAVINRYRSLVGSWRTTVSVQDTDADLTPRGRPTTYSNALLVRISDPEVDAASGDPATFEMEFAVESVA